MAQTKLEDFAEGYNKLHDYLLDNSQQELAGHLDGIWQHAGNLQVLADNKAREQQDVGQTSDNAQSFQDQYKGDDPKTVDKTEAEIDADNLQPDPASENS